MNKKRVTAFILMLCIVLSYNNVTVNAEEVLEGKTYKFETHYNEKIIGYKYKYKWKKVKITKKKYLGKFYITHYCPCEKCCGIGGGKITASGTVPTADRTVGVNPKLIPYGTKLKIGGKSGYVAEDTGGGIGWKHIDMFCNSHQEALNAGVGFKKVWIVKTKYKRKKVKVKIPIYAPKNEFLQGNRYGLLD